MLLCLICGQRMDALMPNSFDLMRGLWPIKGGVGITQTTSRKQGRKKNSKKPFGIEKNFLKLSCFVFLVFSSYCKCESLGYSGLWEIE